MKRKYVKTKLGLPSEGSLVNNDVNPFKNMSYEVKDLPGWEKQNKLLSK